MELSNWFKGFEKGISRLNPEQRTLFFSECGKNCVKCGTLQIYQELYKKAKGDLNTFFSTSYAPQKGNYLTLTLDEPKEVHAIRIVCDDSKEYLSEADLLISADGQHFRKVASFTEDGKAEAKLNGESIQAVKIEVTAPHFSRLTIREIILE